MDQVALAAGLEQLPEGARLPLLVTQLGKSRGDQGRLDLGR